MLFGTRHAGRTQNYAFDRLAALEARQTKRESFISSYFFLPLVFIIFSVLQGRTIRWSHLSKCTYHYPSGTIYFQTLDPNLLITAFGLYSCADILFIYPTMYSMYTKALDIYKFERADNVGRATDLVIQPAVRYFYQGFIANILGVAILYMLVSSFVCGGFKILY